jgi:hypothetical protein
LDLINLLQTPAMHMIRTIPAAKQIAKTAQILLIMLPRQRPEIAKTKAGGHQINSQKILHNFLGKGANQMGFVIDKKKTTVAPIQIKAAKPSHLPLRGLFMFGRSKRARDRGGV